MRFLNSGVSEVSIYPLWTLPDVPTTCIIATDSRFVYTVGG